MKHINLTKRIIQNMLPRLAAFTLFTALLAGCSGESFETLLAPFQGGEKDTTAPKVVSGSSSGGTIGSGSQVAVTISFDEAVTVNTSGGTPTITLSNGKVLTYASGSGSKDLVFTYTVQDGDDFTLDNSEALTIVTNGGSISDTSDNTATNLTVAAPTSVTTVTADGVAPATSTIVKDPATPSIIGNGQTVTIDVTLTEPVTVTNPVTITMSTGGNQTPANVDLTCTQTTAPSSSLECSYTVSGTDDFTFDNSSTLTLGGTGTLADAGGNTISSGTDLGGFTTDPGSITVDGSVASITTISSSPASGDFKVGDTVDISLTYSEAVDLVGGNVVITLSNGKTVTISGDIGTTGSTGDGQTVLTGTYTIGSGDDLTGLTVTTVALSAGALTTDASSGSTNASLALPVGSNLSGINIDTATPSAPDGSKIAFDSANDDSGQFNNDGITSVSTGLTYAGEAGSAEPGSTIVVYNGDPGSGGTQVGTATVNADGSFSVDFDLTPDGTYDIFTTVKDAAGNESTPTDVGTGSLTVDTSAGEAGSIAMGTPSTYDTGSSNTDNITQNTTFPLQGTSENNAIVNIYTDSSKTTLLATTTADGSGNWSTNITLPEGTTSPFVVIEDLAGNVSSGSSGPAITVDTTAPTNQDTVLTASAEKKGGDAVTVTSSGDATNTIWLAPAGTTSFNESNTMTKASGNATSIVAPTNEGDYQLFVVDAAGNVSAASTATVKVDNTVPVLSGLSSTTSDGTYTVGNDINITATFSEPVTLAGGNFNVELETGSTDRTITLSAGSYPATTLTGTYTVQSGDTSNDLTANSTSLSVGGTLVDAAGNNATITIPGGSNIADSKALVIDTAAPYIANITSSTADGTYGSGASVNISIEFSEAVTLAGGTLDVTLETGTTDRVVNIAATTATTLSGSYTVQNGDSSGDLNVTAIALSSGATLQDSLGLNGDLSLPTGSNLADNKAIVIDTSGASVTSITSVTTNGTYGPASSVNVTVNFSESVTLNGTLRLTLSNGKTVDIIETGTAASAFSATYTVGATGSGEDSGDLDATGITLQSGTLVKTSDGSTGVVPALPATTIADGSAIVIDTTAPVLSSITSSSSNATYGLGKTVNITTTFSEAITIAGGNLEVTLETGTPDRVVTITGSGASVSGSYTVQSGDASADLTANSVAAGTGATIADAAGNAATFAIPAGQNLADNQNIVINTTAPVFAGSSLTSDNTSFAITLSKGVYANNDATGALTTGDFDLTFNQNGGNATAASISGITHSAGATAVTLTLSITGTPSGVETVVITPVDGASIFDVGGNVVAGTQSATETLNDKLAPVFTSLDLINDATDNYINAAERGNANDLAGNLNASGHSYTYYALVTSATTCNSSVTYGADGVIPDSNSTDFGSDGSYKVCVKLSDSVGNNTYGATSTFTLDTVAPAAPTALDLAAADDKGTSDTDNITNQTSGLTISGSSAEDISIEVFEGGTTSKCTATASGGAFNCDIALTGSGTPYSITAKATDAAGNVSVASSALSITVDTTDPSVSSITSTTGDGTYYLGNNINVTVTMSEAVTLATGTLDVTLETGAADDIISVTGTYPTSTLAGTYTVGSGDTSSDLDATVIALNGGATLTDVAGNAITTVSLPATTIADGSAIVLDTNVPSITSITASPSSGSFKAGDTIDITINFSENVNLSGGDTGAADLTITLNTGETVTITGALTNQGSLTGTYTIGAGVNVAELNVSTIALTDNATMVDNATTSKNVSLSLPSGQNLADQTGTVIVDNAAPTISSSVLATDNSTLAVTFSEGVYSVNDGTGVLDKNDFTVSFVANGGNAITVTIASVTHTAGNATATLNLSHSTTATGVEQITVKPVASSIYDAAGNAAADTESTTKTLNDTTAPAKPGVADLAAGDDTGSSDTDNITKLTSGLTLTGTVEAGATVEIFRAGSTSLGTVLADGTTGAYSIDVSLAAGAHSVTVKATDSSGNVSVASDPLSITVDTINPIVNGVSSDTANGTYGVGATIDVDVIFSESVYVTTTGGTPTMTLVTGTSQTTNVNYSTVAGSVVTFNYTVASNDESADLSYENNGSLSLNSGLIQDTAGNTAVLTLPTPGNAGSLSANKALVIDGKIPNIINVSADAAYDGSHKAGDTIPIKVTFNEAVTVSGTAATLSLETGTTDQDAVFTSGSGSTVLVFTYTVQSGDSSGDLAYKATSSLSLNADTIKDAAGNNANITLPTPGNSGSLSANNAIVIDTEQPVISSISSSTTNGTYGIGADINVTLTMSEPVTLATGPLNVTLETGTPDRVVSVSAGSYPATTLTGTYTVQSGDTSADLNANVVALGGGSLTDAAGNAANLTLPASNLANNKDIVINTSTANITSITSTTGNGTYGPGSSIDVTVTFSEAVALTGATTGLTVTLDNGATVTMGNFSGSSTSATYTVGATGSGADSGDLDATAITLTDGTLVTTPAGNPVTVALPTTTIADGSAIVVDTTAPVISSISSTTANGTYGDGSNINVTLNFSEEVTLSGTTPSLRATLNTSDVVSYTSISGATSVSGTYTVGSGDSASPLNVNSPLTLAGTSPALKDAAGNDVVLTIGAGNNLADNHTINISTVAVAIQFTSTVSSGLESITSLSLPLELSATTGSDVTVSYTVSGTSASGSDHNLSAGNATITAGSTTGSIPVTITNDSFDEIDETLIVTLSSVTTGNASIGTNTTYTYTINDDDDPPQLRFSSASQNSTGENGVTMTVTASLSLESGKTVSAPITFGGTATRVASCTATDGSEDYVASATSVSIAPGNLTQDITLTICSDGAAEDPNETAILTLGSPTNATLGSTIEHTATITDDDGTPKMSVLAATLAAEGDSGTSTLTVDVNMVGTSGALVSVDYTTVNGSAVAGTCGSAGADYEATSGTLSWASGTSGIKTFSVSVCGDTIAELNETLNATLSNVVGTAEILAGGGSATLTITNDDESLVIGTAETLDCDPVDGKLDHYKVSFVDTATTPAAVNVTDTSFGGYVDTATEGLATDKWAVAGHSNVRIDPPGALAAACGSDTTNDSVVYLKFDPASNSNTGTLPELTATAATLEAGNGSGKLYYNTGNVASTDVTESDKAGPVVVYAIASEGDSSGTGTYKENGVGKDDTLQVRFSETMNTIDLSSTDLDTVFQLNNGHDFGSAADIALTSFSNTNYTNDTLTITFETSTPTVYDGDTITAIGTTLADANGNNPATGVAAPTSILPTFDSGAKGPSVVSAEYLDVEANGFIDHVKVVFSKAVSDSTFPGYVNTNSEGSVTANWQVAGYDGVRINTSDSLDTGDNDDTIYIKFNEGSDYDTDAKPDLTATLGAAGLRDAVDNCYINTTPTDCLNSGAAVVRTTDVGEKDAASAIITYSSARVGDRYIFLKFSEGVYGATGAPACGSGGQLRDVDFSYGSTQGSASDVVGVDSDANCAVNTAYARLFTDTAFDSNDIDSDTIAAATSEIYDAADNAMNNTPSIIRATVAPYLVKASSYTSGGKFYFRVVYSEPMDYTTVTNASNYTLSEDVSNTSCPDIASIPLSVNAISSTIFDLETGAQCGVGDANGETVYKIVASSNILDENEIEGVTNPNTATTVGTSAVDQTPPAMIQALSLSATTVQITYSEPMKSGDQAGSATCASTYTTGATCTADVDGIAGTQLQYSVTPNLGSISSVVATANPSVFIVTHADVQSGSFYNIAAYVENAVNNIPEDLANNDLDAVPNNQATFKGSGSAIDDLTDGSLFDDPFADGSTFAYAFEFNNKVYLGPNDQNSGAFRFEPDASNPITVTFSAACSGGGVTETFGISGGTVCGTDMGPNGENGIGMFQSGMASPAGSDYEILMIGPTHPSKVSHAYISQDIDTQLNYSQCALPGFQATNLLAIQTIYTYKDNLYVGITSNHSQFKPAMGRVSLSEAGGLVSCGASNDLDGEAVNYLGGKNGTPKNTANTGVIGVDIYHALPAGYYQTTGSDIMLMGNNGGVVYSTDIFTATGVPTATGILWQTTGNAFDGSNTLEAKTVGKVRPGEKGIPMIVEYKNALYLARNLDAATASGTPSGGKLYKCTSACQNSASWSEVVDITAFTGGASNQAISMLIVNGDYLYLGTDNTTAGVGVYRASADVTGTGSFTQMGPTGTEYGLGLGASVAPYIFSSATANKQGTNFLYITVGPNTDAIKVVTQHD